MEQREIGTAAPKAADLVYSSSASYRHRCPRSPADVPALASLREGHSMRSRTLLPNGRGRIGKFCM